jgi:hypothetical protein
MAERMETTALSFKARLSGYDLTLFKTSVKPKENLTCLSQEATGRKALGLFSHGMLNPVNIAIHLAPPLWDQPK